MFMNARGIDVSRWQAPEKLNWTAIAAEHSFAFVRATYGTRTDRHFGEHIRGAQNAGMIVGGYHFFRQTQPVEEQIHAFFATLDDAGCGPGWLPPTIDVESNVAFDGPVNVDVYRDGVRRMIDACRARYGGAIVYVNPSDAALLGNPDWFRDEGVILWIAHHGAKIPSTPNAAPWSFWQTTDEGRIAGYEGKIDLNLFAGPADKLPVIVADTEQPTAPDTERPSPPTVDEHHAVHLAKLDDIAASLSNGFLEQSARLARIEALLDRLIAMVASTNATLTDHHERIDTVESRMDDHMRSNGAAHG